MDRQRQGIGWKTFDYHHLCLCAAFEDSTEAGKLSDGAAIVGLCLCKIALPQVERFSQPARGERFWGIAASCTTRTSESSGSRGAPCG